MSSRHIRQTTHARQPVSPVHRGPQAVQQPVIAQGSLPAPMPFHAPNAALLIDFDNVTMGIRSDLAAELKSLLSSDIVRGKVSVQRAYADWRRYPQYIVPLSESSIDLIFAPAYGSSKKNATDIRLAIDALELVFTRPEIGTFILLSGDSDFSSLVIKLKEYGKYVIGVGIRESSSDLLVQNCDEYYSYNALAGLVNTRDEEVVKWDPWELAVEAMQRMKRNGDVMRADRLKQVMQQIDSSFDEKNLGMSKFSRFIIEGSHRGILTLHKMENGQYEVDLPKTPDITGGAAQVDSKVSDGLSEQSTLASAGMSAEAGEAAAESSTSGASSEERRGPRGRPPRRGWKQGRGDGRPRSDAASAQASNGVAQETTRHAEPQTASASSTTSPAKSDPQLALPVDSGTKDSIGVSGMRLTRDEAFDLVKRSVASLTTGDVPAMASKVRAEARRILGRDSESLSERNFIRILQDAHNGDVVDLRRRGNDYEVSAVVETASIAEQLSASTAVDASAKVSSAADNGSVPQSGGRAVARGMGPRGIPSSRGGFGKKPSDLPADLLSIGVVNYVSATPKAASAAPVVKAEAAAASDKSRESGEPNESKETRQSGLTGSGLRGRRKGGARKSAPAASAETERAVSPNASAETSRAASPAAPAKTTAVEASSTRGRRGRPPAAKSAVAAPASAARSTSGTTSATRTASAPAASSAASSGASKPTARRTATKKTAVKKTSR